MTDQNIKFQCRDVRVHYGDMEALHGITMDVQNRGVTALIGPSGCGKSSFLRVFNRMNDTIPGCKVTGDILMDGQNIYAKDMDPVMLRARVGMVFQKANPFPKSIYENVAYGPRIHGLAKNRQEMDEIVETSLRKAGLWAEVKDRLKDAGTGLSGGQQQRLVIARCIAINPEVILMDEPASALDPIATAKLEELIEELKEQFCILIVTHSMAQARRVSDKTAFFHMGDLVEYGNTNDIFETPQDQRTQDYVQGRTG